MFFRLYLIKKTTHMHPITRVYARYIDKLDIKKSQPKNPKYKYISLVCGELMVNGVILAVFL